MFLVNGGQLYANIAVRTPKVSPSTIIIHLPNRYALSVRSNDALSCPVRFNTTIRPYADTILTHHFLPWPGLNAVWRQLRRRLIGCHFQCDNHPPVKSTFNMINPPV
jgi:hypothetical protein